MSDHTPNALLPRALDQAAALLEEVTPEVYGQRSTCSDWTVEDLVRHIVASPANFVTMFSGGEVDWANPPALGDDPAGDFRAGAAQLVEHLSADESGAGAGPALPEYAVHSWDLARSIGSSRSLDDEVAQSGYDFMTANLTNDNRGGAFGNEQSAPEGADIHDRLAAFAGRRVRS